MMDPQQVLTRLNFGRVDGETDNRFENCFIGTEMLRQVLLPQHSLVVGNKGSGKSAICRLLSDDIQKVRPLLPKEFEEIYTIPAYGLQSEEYLPGVELRELNPESVDEFRYFWLLYLGLKTASTLLQDAKMQALLAKCKEEKVKDAVGTLKSLLVDVGLIEETSAFGRVKRQLGKLRRSKRAENTSQKNEKALASDFKQKTGISIIALLDSIDTILRETNCLAWIMLDKLDLLFVDDIQKLRASITGLVQLLVQYGNQFKNIHFKIFLRNDIYSQLHIVNKSHLISYTTEMKWRGPLLMKLLVSRAVVDSHVRAYCEEVLGEKVDVTNIILGADDYVEKVFYTIFETTTNGSSSHPHPPAPTHQWILKRLVDGMGNSFPRELIHLGNRAVEKQREYNRQGAKHTSARLISIRALKEAFESISEYRCDTYLYSEFPHLSKHFDVFRGSDTATFHREELYMLFEPLSPKGDEAIRAVYDAGLLMPLGNNVDSSRKFKVPLLYRAGLGITERRQKQDYHKKHNPVEHTPVDQPKMN
ncbi:MAG: hypothetical protein HYR76_08365 [Ignavibacteria bacterium]|nr:hypothetical protein [Ignavibacteria bacterium]MBI3765401.1 hypothetical protein [Ignavibacteriales bacterium]